VMYSSTAACYQWPRLSSAVAWCHISRNDAERYDEASLMWLLYFCFKLRKNAAKCELVSLAELCFLLLLKFNQTVRMRTHLRFRLYL